MNQVFFTVKPQEGIVATSFKEGDKFYIGPDKLLPLERFLPKPKAAPGMMRHLLPQALANVQKAVKYPNLVVQPGEVAGLRGEEERLGVAEEEDSPVAAGLPEVVADQEGDSLLGVVAAVLLLGVEVDSGVVADLFCTCSVEPFTFVFAQYSGVITMLLSYL